MTYFFLKMQKKKEDEERNLIFLVPLIPYLINLLEFDMQTGNLTLI